MVLSLLPGGSFQPCRVCSDDGLTPLLDDRQLLNLGLPVIPALAPAPLMWCSAAKVSCGAGRQGGLLLLRFHQFSQQLSA
jgi:hypothetical protein